jgi:predicted nuclease of predicted toxin-antitoxin system
MRILFDQGTPVPLRAFLSGHDIKTAAEQGWSELSNGKLLDAAETAGFEALVTTDKNFPHQQNLQARKIAIIIIGNAQWPILKRHVELVVNAIKDAKSGTCILVEIPEV